MWTVIGSLSFCFFGITFALSNNGTFARTKAQPQARMQMQDLLAPIGSSGNRPTCMHDGRWYYERSVIPTIDSCINCKCENGMVRCNMTLCPMYPNVQDGCQLTHEEGSCCPQLVCTENVAKKLSSVPEIHDATLLGCSYNDFEFGLGDFIPTSDPCQACYCIHNRTQCVHQNCALPESAREGCRPVYHHGICCPIRYDCAEAMAVPPTQRPAFTSEGCAVNNKLYDEGEAIPSGKPCEHCYCMKGEMICAMQKCDSPMAGCVPVIKEGQCCPERFECPNVATTPAPWNNTGAVFAEPTAKRKLTLNITIETKFPHQQQQQQKFSSTTRALDDDNSLLGDLQHTTSPTVTSTSPSLPVELNVTQSLQNGPGLPTVQPTAAQIGFQGTVLSGNRSAQLTMRINGTQQFPNINRRVPPLAPGLSSPWLPSDIVNQGGSFDSNTDVLQYNIAQNKLAQVAPVSASEILNSGSPLGTRQPVFNLSFTLNSTAPSANGSFSVPVNSNPADRLITHLVGGSTSASSSSSSDIPLNSKINMTSETSLLVNGPVAINLNGTNVPLASGSKLIASASGNSSIRAVLLAPLDPSPSDPYEGFIRAPVNPINKNLPTMIALDPSSNAEIEGAASVSNPAEKLVVQVPFAHLTDFGLAVQDPSASDQLEGQISTRNGNNSQNSTANPSKKLSPLDPTSSSEIEGWLKSPSIASLQLPNNSAVTVDVKTANIPLAAIDPQSNSEIEGALSFANPIEKIAIPALPLDPESQSQIDGLFALTDLSQKSGAQVQPPIDPSQNSEVEGALSLNSSTASQLVGTASQPVITAVLHPLDPTRVTEIEGALNSGKNITSVQPVSSAALGDPLDPSQTEEIEGALSTLTKIRPAAPGSLNPTDPVPSDQFEGAFVSKPVPASNDQTGGAVVVLKPLINKPVNLTNNRIVENSAVVVDPSSAGDVEGVLAWSNPIQKVGDGLLHPFDPVAADNIEGLASSKLSTRINLPFDSTVNESVEGAVKPVSLPIEPVASDNVEGIWNTAQLINVLNKSSTPILNVNRSSQLPQGPDQSRDSSGQNSTTGKIPLAGDLANTRQLTNVGGAAVTSENLTLSAIPTNKPNTSMPLTKLNGGVPANLMLTLDAAKDAPASDRSTRPLALNLTLSNNNNVNESKIILLPADPDTTDDVEGQFNQIRVPSSARPAVAVDPLPTDEYEGVEKPNEATISKPETSTTTPWAIFTNQHNDSSVSRWVIRTQNIQGSGGRNITWLPGTPLGGAEQAILPTASSTSVPTTSTVISASTLIPKTSTATKILARDSSTSTLPTRPTTISSTATSPSSSSTWSSSELSTTTTATTTTTEVLEGAPDIQSVLQLSNLDKLSSMRIKENRRATSTATTVDNSITDRSELYTTSAPVWAGVSQASVNSNGSLPVSSGFAPGAPLTGIYENGCFYDGVYYRNYQSVPTSDLVDPCMVRLCKDGVILGPSEQRCPPPIEGCFSTSIPGVCCPVYLCPNYLERNETSYTLTAATGDTLNTEKTKLALAKFCRVGPRFLALNERVVHVMGVQCQTCTCKPKGIVCEPGCAQGILITTEMPPVMAPRRFQTFPTTSTTTLPSTVPPVTEPAGARSCVIQKKRFQNGEEVSFNDPCHICNCMDGLVICKINRKGCRSAKLLSESEGLF